MMLVVALPHTLPRRWSLLLVISTECSPLTPPLPLLGTGFRGVGFLEEGVFLVYRTEIILLVLDQSRLLFDSEPKLRECLFQPSWWSTLVTCNATAAWGSSLKWREHG